MPEKPAPPLSETLYKSAKYYAAKSNQENLFSPEKLQSESQGIATILMQADHATHIREYTRLMCTAAVLGGELNTKQGDFAAAKFLFSQAAAAKALELISVLQSIEPTQAEMKDILDKSGFWDYFQP